MVCSDAVNGVEAVAADREIHVCEAAGHQHASVPVRPRLPRHIGESGIPGYSAYRVIRCASIDECAGDAARDSLTGLSDPRFGHRDTHPPPTLQLAKAMVGAAVWVNTALRLLAQLDISDQITVDKPARVAASFFNGSHRAVRDSQPDTPPAAIGRRTARRPRRFRAVRGDASSESPRG